MADRKLLENIDNEIQAEVSDAVEFALNAPHPNTAEVAQHVYA
jgi:TPP-dependent pyruvate/acetoin dehydrogenase alpha subunit